MSGYRTSPCRNAYTASSKRSDKLSLSRIEVMMVTHRCLADNLVRRYMADAREAAYGITGATIASRCHPRRSFRMSSGAGGNNEGIPSFFGGRRPQILGGYRGRSVCVRWGVGVTQATHVWQRSGRARRCCCSGAERRIVFARPTRVAPLGSDLTRCSGRSHWLRQSGQTRGSSQRSRDRGKWSA